MIQTLNSMGGRWWSWVAAMAWQVALLALVVWLIDLVLRRRGWPQVRYALWALVLVKLFIPPTFALPSSVFGRVLPASQQAAPLVAPDTVEIAAPVEPAYFEPLPRAVSADTPAEPLAAAAAPAEAAASASLSAKAWGMLGSGAASVLLLAWLIVRALKLRTLILADATVSAPDWIVNVLARCAHRIGLRRVPRVVVTEGVKSAAVFGILRPVLLLPQAACEVESPLQMEHIMLHELAHVKRGDLVMNTAQALVQVAFWFHPAVWLAGRQLRHLRELCCDASVSRLLRERTSEYRETLAHAARSMIFGRERPGLGLLGLFESASRLRQRLEHLERPSWKHARLKLIASLAAVALMVACIVPMARVAAEATSETAETGEQHEWPFVVSGPVIEQVLGEEPESATGEAAVPRSGESAVTTAETIDDRLDSMVNITFSNTPLADLAAMLQAVTGVGIVVIREDLPPDGAPVTLATETTLKNVLGRICELTGMAWKVEGGLVKIGRPETIRAGALARDLPAGGRVRVRALDGRVHVSQNRPGEWIPIGMGLWWWYSGGERLEFRQEGPRVYLSLDGEAPRLAGIRVRSPADLAALEAALREPSARLSVWLGCRALEGMAKLEELHRVTSLHITPSAGLPDLSAITRLQGLRHLCVGGARDIHDVGPLATLKGMRSLWIFRCDQVTDLSPLGDLVNLTDLKVQRCQRLADVSAVSKLRNLSVLALMDLPKVSRLPAMTELTSLRSLFISEAEGLTDLSELAGAANLRRLKLTGCRGISDLSPVANLTQLTHLRMIRCAGVRDLSPLATLRNLSAMRLFQCDGVSDISPLGELIQLTDLDLKGCPSISDISPLAGLDSLARVDLRGCESIGEIAPLRGTVRRGGTVYVDDRLSPQYEQLRAEAAEAVRAAISQTGTSQVPSAEELPGVAGESDELRGRVVLPDGTPLADAEVVLCLPYNSVQIWNGGDRINAEDRRTARTDSGGRFSFRKPKLGELRWMLEMPPGLIRDATLRYLIVVRHGYGYAEVTPRQLAASPEITVQPWGKVEGRLLIGRAPGAHEPIRMECDLARSPVDRETPTVLRNNWSMTDAEGRFVFGMVAPGEWRIYQAIKVHGDRNGSMWARTQDVSVVVAPGETHQVDLGGVGRPVIGRLVMPTGGPLPVGYATVHMFPRDDETRGPGAAGMRFGNKAESDGTFRIEDVRPGPYTLRASLYELRPRDRDGIIRGHASYDFEVPGVPDGWSDEPLDLGTLEFELRK